MKAESSVEKQPELNVVPPIIEIPKEKAIEAVNEGLKEDK